MKQPSRFIFASSWTGPTWIWDLDSKRKLVEIEKDPDTKVDGLAFAHNGTVLYGTVWPSHASITLFSPPKEFAAWDVETGKKIWSIEKAELLYVELDGEFVDLSCFNIRGLRRKRYQFSSREVVAESVDRGTTRQPISRSDQFTVGGIAVVLTDLHTGNQTALSGDDNYLVRSNNGQIVCAFHPENGRLFAGATDGSIRVWNTGHGSLDRILRGHGAPINCMTVSKNGKWLATGDWNGEVRLWQPDDSTDQVNLVLSLIHI